MNAQFFKGEASRLLIPGSAVACVLLGFALGRGAAPPAERRPILPDASSQKLEQSARTSSELWKDRRSALSKLRIDQLSHVPISELRALLANRDASEMSQIAHKFDILAPNPATYASLRPFFKTWAEMDAVAAFRGAVSLPDARLRSVAVDTIAQAASPDGAGRIVQLLIQQSAGTFQEGIQNSLLDAAVSNWSQTSPAAAAEFILNDSECRARIGQDILRNWGWLEGPTAVRWLEEHPGKNGNEFSDLLLGWIEKDASAASDYLTAHIDTPKVQESIGTAAFGMFCVNKDLALHWTENLPSAEVREAARLRIADYYAEVNPSEAAEWSTRMPPDGRQAPLAIVLRRWSRQDSDAALAWINRQGGDVRDGALEAFALSVPETTQGKAVNAAKAIADPLRRKQTMQAVIGNWLQTSRAEAEAWVNSNLSAQQKAELLSESSADPSP